MAGKFKQSLSVVYCFDFHDHISIIISEVKDLVQDSSLGSTGIGARINCKMERLRYNSQLYTDTICNVCFLIMKIGKSPKFMVYFDLPLTRILLFIQVTLKVIREASSHILSCF